MPPTSLLFTDLDSLNPADPLRHDRTACGGHPGIAGIDEAGRGSMAGPVTAAAVFLPRAFLEDPPDWTRWVTDSKALSQTEREDLEKRIRQASADGGLFFGIGWATVSEIDREDILGATCLAMERAFEVISRKKVCNGNPLQVDGRPIPRLRLPHLALVKGDRRSLSIAMASVLAKTARDREMGNLAQQHPPYQWETNKGYGTLPHRRAILSHGVTPEHRRHFLRNLSDLADIKNRNLF